MARQALVDAAPAERRVDLDREAGARDIVDDGQAAEAATSVEHVEAEVELRISVIVITQIGRS